MHHWSLRIFIRDINSRVIGVFVVRLSLHRMVVICCGSGVFLVILSMIIRMILGSKKSFWSRICYFWIYELYWTGRSKVIVVSLNSERRDVSTSRCSASHGRQTWRNMWIFSFKAIGWLIGMRLNIWKFVVFSLNKKNIYS